MLSKTTLMAFIRTEGKGTHGSPVETPVYSPDKGPERRGHWSQSHRVYHQPLCPSAGRSWWSQRPGNRVYSDLLRQLQGEESRFGRRTGKPPRCCAASCSPIGAEAVLTSAVLGKPPHVRGEAVDVEMFTIKVRALLLPEVSLAFWT